ncbi:helix-turn-helix transcriptional regulator [Streptomyces sp. WAC 00631]|uniref:helix-turn-helix domain-containing protein n=1 Tax=unclassified Streptomyces TaxID=2593676 RepID=UPI000F7B26B8|nr:MULTISPECIES: helix-turn-helix transcriptional regulator [unclassified Streptomyces]MCC5033558.1 helix-turn-helix transcriptional regulator [Streptomyces sp. WAC 00631]MCC9743043.1 helix-turn-helix transcriptional regulator [Streptomyces sp. MNU89]
MSTPSAAVQRLRLRTELRKARSRAGLTQRQVAATMEWSPSKLIRIEAGEVAITVNDLKALLAEYAITDRRKTEELLQLARGSRKMPFSEYRDVFGREFLSFLALESSASIIRGFHFFVIPGLFQTEEYIRALSKETSRGMSQERLDRLVEARLARQELLEGDEGPQIFMVLDESVIRRQIGGPGVMRNQLERLADLASRPRITIQILPFSVGAHQGLLGPYTLFEFSEDGMPDSVYLENARGESYASNDPEITGKYLEGFWALEDQALKEDMSTVLRQVAAHSGEVSEDLVVRTADGEQQAAG